MKIAICDDDDYYLNFVYERVDQFFTAKSLLVNIHKFTKPSELLEAHINQPFDLIFLDIVFKADLGIDYVNRLKNIKMNTIIILMSSYEQYIFDGFEVGAFQYLTKPINETLLLSELERASHTIFNLERKIPFYTYNGLTCLSVNEINYVEIAYKEFFIHTDTETYSGTNRKSEFKLTDFDEFGFVVINKTLTVNLRKIKFYSKCTLTLYNDELLDISRLRKTSFEEKYINYIRSLS